VAEGAHHQGKQAHKQGHHLQRPASAVAAGWCRLVQVGDTVDIAACRDMLVAACIVFLWRSSMLGPACTAQYARHCAGGKGQVLPS
jgi:hypothetical protein